MMGMFDLFVCFWNKTMILCPPLSHSRIRRSTRDPPQISNICLSFSLIWFRNKTLLYKLSLQGWKTVFLRLVLETLRSKLGLCLHYSTPSLSLDFSSSLLGDPSWLPKLSLEWNSRWLHVTTCKKKNKQINTQTQSKNEKDYWKTLGRCTKVLLHCLVFEMISDSQLDWTSDFCHRLAFNFSLLKRSKFVHPRSNIQNNKSIKNALFYSKILFLSFVFMSIFPAKQCGKKPSLTSASKVRG